MPGVDWLLQKFVVKKNAAKKLGQLFGIDVRFIEDNSKNKRAEEKNPIKKPEYITKGVED